MNDLVDFLTSQEILFVYLISASAGILCLIVYLVQKKSELFRRRQNTKELNKLVEQVKERTLEVENNNVSYGEPIIQSVEEVKPAIEVLEEIHDDSSIVEEVHEDVVEEEEQLEYTTIEPDQETARLELQRLKEELEKQEAKERQEEMIMQEEISKEETVEEETINIDEYEDDMEATAIISMDELLEKSRELYTLNELSQYASDMNQPISIQDLEKQMAKAVTKYDEPFIIENVVVDEGIEENNEEVNEVRPEANVVASVEKKFKSSPIISPIYGIEKNPSEDNSLALENTANYEKLDQQLQKSNDFAMTLKEFQKNL